ncbi:MAG TPA: hypothetical protein VFS05_10775, partial [Gemmatimonadaceae bacterium]|nr:hypothetical protein [Gemmatimonadaceae bacterium]
MVISARDRVKAAPRDRMWGALSALAVLAGALWLRDPAVRYLIAAGAATLASLALAAVARAPARRWAIATSGVLALFVLGTALAQWRLARIDAAWPAYRASLVAGAGRALAARMDAALATLREVAARAVEAPADPREALAALRAAPLGPEQGVVLYRAGAPVAWAGRSYAPPTAFERPVAVVSTPFYVSLQVQVQRGDARAIATAVVHAVPPADSLTDAVDERVARRSGVRGFEIIPVGGDTLARVAREAAREGALLYAPLGDTLLVARPLPPAHAEARGDALRRARAMGGLLLALILALLAAATWRREPSPAWRLLPLGVALACVALVPLNQLSNVTFLFDPAVYFDTVGGPYTASIGALLLTGAVVLLGIFVVLRAHAPTRSRALSAATAVAVMLVGPFLLRVLSRGISPPIEGITTSLWLAWEVALFLVGAALL